MAGVEGRADLAAHLRRRDKRLAVEMATALGKILIFELDSVRPGALELADRAHDVKSVAVTGIAVNDQMRADAVADQRQRLDDLGHADESHVRPPQPRIGD